MSATGYDGAPDGDLAEAHRRWNEDVSVDDVRVNYDGEWILLRITEYGEHREASRGVVVVHDLDNRPIWQTLKKLKDESPNSADHYYIFQASPLIRTEEELLKFLVEGGEFLEVPIDWRR